MEIEREKRKIKIMSIFRLLNSLEFRYGAWIIAMVSLF